MVTKLTVATFEAEAMKSTLPVLVDFYADWCGPCKMVAPIVEKLSEKYEGRLKVCKVNVDEEFPVAAAFSVQSIPTLVLLKNGETVKKSIGFSSEVELSAMIDEVLSL